MKHETTYICDACGKEGTYGEVGRGDIIVFGNDPSPLLKLNEICDKCAVKAVEAIKEKLKIN